MNTKARKLGLLVTALTVAGLAMGLAALILGTTPVLAVAAIIYVDDDTCPAAGDGSLATPYCSIQDGLDDTADGDIVSVAAGTYDSTYETFPLTVYTDNVSLIGAGAGSTTIDGGARPPS
ncbi:MAG: DUF1565 domain-containing protein [Anaerolineae bacterium]|jgi:hypothetical protein